MAMPDRRADAELVRLTTHGDTDAYGVLVARYKNEVYAIARRITGDHHSAEDVAQESFIDAYMQLESLENAERFAAWLAAIVRRKSIRCTSRRRYVDDIDACFDLAGDASPERDALRREDADAVRRAIESLSEKNRTVARMFYLDEMPIDAVARALDLPVGTVKSRLHDARSKLKGVLSYMNEKQTLSPDFDEQIKSKITELRGYYMINGADHTFDRSLAELEKHILSEPIETKRNALLADLWAQIYVGASRPDENRIVELAEAGNNGDAYAWLRLDDALSTDDYAAMLEAADKMIAKLRGMSGTTGIGIYLFWRGRAKIGLGRLAEAIADFREAYRLTPPDNVYNALCACALKTYDFLTENSDDPCLGFQASGEQYYFDGERLAYVCEPGFGDNIAWRNNYYGMFTYVISRFDNVFFDTTMSVGETRTSRDEKSTLTLVSLDETVTTPAGEFADCMHISMNIKGEYTADAWYAKDVGLVRTVIVSTSFSEEYILADYTHVGGSGYYPFAVGNRWRYEKPDMPDELCYLFENEITWTNGTTANISTSHPVGYKKGEQANDSYLLQRSRL